MPAALPYPADETTNLEETGRTSPLTAVRMLEKEKGLNQLPKNEFKDRENDAIPLSPPVSFPRQGTNRGR